MAIVKTISTEFNYDAEFSIVEQIVIEKPIGRVTVGIALYKDQASFNSGAKPIRSYTEIFEGSDAQTMVNSILGIIQSGLVTRDPWTGGQVV